MLFGCSTRVPIEGVRGFDRGWGTLDHSAGSKKAGLATHCVKIRVESLGFRDYNNGYYITISGLFKPHLDHGPRMEGLGTVRCRYVRCLSQPCAQGESRLR